MRLDLRPLPTRGFRPFSRATGILLLLTTACSQETVSPSDLPGPESPAPESPPPASPPPETPLPPAGAVLDNRSSSPGIVFGSWNMPNSYLTSVHTGWMNGGPLDPNNIETWLAGARAKGARVVIKLCKGRDGYIQNSDGTFSFTKWKELVSRYRSFNFGPYLSDGTILAHFLVDEPHRAAKWGGKTIPPATLEAMAAYSKQLWPSMPTVVGEEAHWLANTSTTYTHLDAAWPQYRSSMGSVSSWVSSQVAAAQQKKLGVVIGMNVMDGGNGSSGIRGRTSGKWAMSASELRTYGSALLAQSYVCGYYNWTHDDTYFSRSDIKSAMSDLSSRAKQHAKTSCRQ